MRFVVMLKMDVLGMSRERYPLDVTVGPARIWQNKVETDEMKLHLYKMFKIDALFPRTSL